MGLYVPWQSQEREIHPVIKPFHWAEQRMEALLGWLKELAFLEILGVVSNIGLLIAVATYIGSEKQRRDAEVLNAWQTITSAYGQAGSGGRIQALEFLNASPGANWRRKFPWFCTPHPLCTWSSESLAGINLSVPDGVGFSIYLFSVQLPNADLGNANLEEAFLYGANLKGADLGYANLERAVLKYAHMEGVNLEYANLNRVILYYADLESADLLGANLEEAFLPGANLKEAILEKANLKRATLSSANLEGAVLLEANLLEANLEGAEGLTYDQLAQAKLCRTIFADGISLDPNRNCKEIDTAP